MSIYNSYVVPPGGVMAPQHVHMGGSQFVRTVPTVTVPTVHRQVVHSPMIVHSHVAPAIVANKNYLMNAWKAIIISFIPYSLLWMIRSDVFMTYMPGANGSFTWFALILLFGVLFGGFLGGMFMRSRGNARQCAMLGFLMMAPWFFTYWRYLVDVEAAANATVSPTFTFNLDIYRKSNN